MLRSVDLADRGERSEQPGAGDGRGGAVVELDEAGVGGAVLAGVEERAVAVIGAHQIGEGLPAGLLLAVRPRRLAAALALYPWLPVARGAEGVEVGGGGAAGGAVNEPVRVEVIEVHVGLQRLDDGEVGCRADRHRER